MLLYLRFIAEGAWLTSVLKSDSFRVQDQILLRFRLGETKAKHRGNRLRGNMISGGGVIQSAEGLVTQKGSEMADLHSFLENRNDSQLI